MTKFSVYSKFSKDDLLKIVHLHNNEQMYNDEIAKKFNCSEEVIANLLSRFKNNGIKLIKLPRRNQLKTSFQSAVEELIKKQK